MFADLLNNVVPGVDVVIVGVVFVNLDDDWVEDFVRPSRLHPLSFGFCCCCSNNCCCCWLCSSCWVLLWFFNIITVENTDAAFDEDWSLPEPEIFSLWFDADTSIVELFINGFVDDDDDDVDAMRDKEPSGPTSQPGIAEEDEVDGTWRKLTDNCIGFLELINDDDDGGGGGGGGGGNDDDDGSGLGLSFGSASTSFFIWLALSIYGRNRE